MPRSYQSKVVIKWFLVQLLDDQLELTHRTDVAAKIFVTFRKSCHILFEYRSSCEI